MLVIKSSASIVNGMVSEEQVMTCLRMTETKLTMFSTQFRRPFAAIALIDRSIEWRPGMTFEQYRRLISYEVWIGDLPETIARDYLENARHKLWTGWRTGHNNRQVLCSKKLALDGYDSLWLGTAMLKDIAGAASALDENEDEALSWQPVADIQCMVNKARGVTVQPEVARLREEGMDTWGQANFNYPPDLSKGWEVY